MAFTGDMVNASSALAMGLVSRVVPDDKLMEEAMALANRIAANPPQALRWTKRLIREGQQIRLDTLLEMAASFQALVHTTADHREAATAFVEKRKPVFRGN
jgi:1,4-dihydroxy-2-naphthoyl-CoA synthase